MWFIHKENFDQSHEFKYFLIKYKMQDFEENKAKRLEGVDALVNIDLICDKNWLKF